MTRKANYEELCELTETLKGLAIGSFEAVTFELAKETLAEDSLTTSELKLKSIVVRANAYAMGAVIANLFETPDADILLDEGETCEQWREERRVRYVAEFTSPASLVRNEAKPEAVTVQKEIGHVKFTYCYGTAQAIKNGDKHIGHAQDLRHGYHIGSLFESVFGEFYVVTANRLKTIGGNDLSALEHNLRGNH